MMFLKYFSAYLKDRFPPALNSIAILLFYSCTWFAALAFLNVEPVISWRFFGGYLLVLLIFYHLRVLDDQKDREKDMEAYPNRVLSRGLFSYRQLWMTGLAALSAEIVLAGFLGSLVFGLFLVVVLYSLLMFKEFFVANWLNKHLFLYGVSHMFILSCIDYMVLHIPVLSGGPVHRPEFIYFALLSFFMTFSLEVARKIRIPAQEKDSVDTYSKALGVRNSLILVCLFQAGVFAISLRLGRALALSNSFYILNALAWGLVAVAYILIYPKLTAEKCLKLDKTASVFYMVFYVSLLTQLVYNQWGNITFEHSF